ncbi:hypothetical protein [Plebeiibacterium sediminum]|uniref:Uncharacterized protein n=1 Tax=Plebeiibacterium sediminum TaxID=2992112 RepID=A0AAE3M3X5_9BACT|nr:hypothetical protein [Plebeiobacterium sediminum]MCW3786350.1 hypothetical protein [Plebeiobacterium sediminum]
MNKEALLNIILSDINEVETLLKSFQGSEEIPAAFIDLTERKMTHVIEEFALLKSLTQNPSPSKPHTTVVEQKAEPVIVETKETQVEAPATPDIKEEKVVVVEELKEEQPQIIEPVPVVTEDTNPIVEEKIITEVTTEEVKAPVEKVEIEEEVIITAKSEIIETPAPEPKKEEVKEDTAKTLGESLIGEKKSVNDLIANNKESKLQQTLMGKPVADLTKSLGLNDRFMFQRELFEGKADVMKQTLLQLNEMPDFNTAQAFISSNFSWDNEQEATQAFYSYIKRKYY